MDYEKKYKDLIEAVKELQEANPSNEGIQKWVEDNVPQLAKSKDEKIRKYLIILLQHFCKGYRVPGLEFPISFKDMLIWLEKQKPIEDFNGEDYGIDSLWHAITILEKTLGEVEGYQTDDGILEHKCAITAVRKLAKERREQKPVEEVKGISHKWYMCIEGVENFSKGCLYKSNIDDQGTEWITDDTEHSFVYGYYLRYFRPATEEEIPHEPKFKVGDWVVWDNKISCLVNNIYQGKESLMYTIIDTNNMVRTYSVKGFDNNAHLWSIKDAKDGDVLVASDGSIFLFAGVVDCACRYYVALTACNDVKINKEVDGGYWETSRAVHPATKEQRAILFQKMSDAGYAFDFDKKEMMKIEEELITGVEIPFGAKDSELEEVFYSIPNGFHAEIEDDKVVIKKGEKKSWSEEDNFMYNKIKNLLTDISLAPESIKSLFDWLKDLRDRVQPQTTWKPSEEQIGALEHFVRSITECGFASPYDSNTKLVYSLFNDLKKLREE